MRHLLNRMIGLLFNNFGYKLLSILLAVIVWAIIQGEQIQEINREVQVTVHVATGYGIRGELVRIKAATIRGPQAWLLEVPKRLTAEVFVPAGVKGSHPIRLSKDNVKNLNERLELIIHEPYLDLYVDKLIEKLIPIKDAIHGTPAEGLIVEKVNIEPKTVSVKGIREDLLRLRAIFTEPIDVSGLSESRTLEVRLVSPGLDYDGLSLDRVRVEVKIGNSKINRKFDSIPIEISGGNLSTRVKPQFVSVTVQAIPAVINKLKRTDFKAYVEVRELGPGVYEEEVRVKIPPDTALIETAPEKAMVTVQH